MANVIASHESPHVGARPQPAGRAAIVLGACAPGLVGRRLAIEGRRVQAVRFGRIALLLSFVDGAAYAPDELERLRLDPARLEAEARLLETAVERARAHGEVVPMRLLTVFAHPESLEEAAREHYARWARALARMRGKIECVVHLFAGPHVAPGSAPYVLRVAQNVSRTGRPPALKGTGLAVEHARRVWRECAAVASATRRVATSGERGVLWSGAMLLEGGTVDALAAVLERSTVAGIPLGVAAYLEMPRAPFCFVAGA